MADDFEKQTLAFLDWLEKVGVQISPKVSLVDLRAEGRGRGLVSVADIEEDEILFSIPRASTLSVKYTLNDFCKANSGASSEILVKLPKWAALTTVMISEMSKSISRWTPYLAVLPSQLDSLVFWSSAELAELQASKVVMKVGKLDAENLFEKSITQLVSVDTDLNLFHRVASIIMAYAFDIPEDEVEDESHNTDELVPDDDVEKSVLSMIPLADMLNADADRNNARLVCDQEDLEMRATKPIKYGEEILNDYGQLPRSDLLRRYGYITDNYSAYDVVEIMSNSIAEAWTNDLIEMQGSKLNAAETDARLELAKREDVFEDSYDISHANSETRCIPDELVALIYLFMIDDETFSLLQSSKMSLPSRNKMETEVVGKVLKQLLELREREYSTTLEEDDKILREGGCSYRRQMAIKVRQGEKSILREAMQETCTYQGSNIRMRTQGRKRGRLSEPPTSQKRSRLF